ncbi:MAG: dihydroorotate dehydrogenase electron transfer subunit [Ruminococcus sp.]|jgi:dihydroorotate dehydrogenase electron transfer subunit
MKTKELCRVLSQEMISPEIYSLWVKTDRIADEALPGQFVTLYSKDGSRMLPRPISLCEIDKEQGSIRLVYRIAGEGTKEFSRLQAGDEIEVMGPLGNGFPMEEARGKRVLLMGGGIGIPPMVETAKQLEGEVSVAAGYRDALFLTEELSRYGNLYIATEDGSSGTKGNVLDAVREKKIESDLIFACGPKPMLKAIKAYAQEHQIPCWVSMEEKMACGIGACLACTCQSAEVDGHSHVKNKRVCKDGPVFLASEVELS